MCLWMDGSDFQIFRFSDFHIFRFESEPHNYTTEHLKTHEKPIFSRAMRDNRY